MCLWSVGNKFDSVRVSVKLLDKWLLCDGEQNRRGVV